MTSLNLAKLLLQPRKHLAAATTARQPGIHTHTRMFMWFWWTTKRLQIHPSWDGPELLMKPRTPAGVWRVEGETMTVPHPERTNKRARGGVNSQPTEEWGEAWRHDSHTCSSVSALSPWNHQPQKSHLGHNLHLCCHTNRPNVWQLKGCSVDVTIYYEKWIHQQLKIHIASEKQPMQSKYPQKCEICPKQIHKTSKKWVFLFGILTLVLYINFFFFFFY